MGMDYSTAIQIILQWLIWIVPSTAIYLVGAIIAAYHLTRLPRPAKFALAGCGLCLFCTGLSVVPIVFSQTSWALFAMDNVYLYYITNTVSAVLGAVGFGLVFAAVFIDRRPPEPPPEIE